MKNVRVARRYAKALMQASEHNKIIDGTAEDLSRMSKVYDLSREFRLMIASPVVAAAKKMSVFKQLFQSKVQASTLSFVELLLEKKRETYLSDIVEQFLALRDELYGIVNVDVSSAVEVLPAQEKLLSQRLEQYTKKKVRVRFSLDSTLKGGLVVRIGDTVLDASVKHQLELLREQLGAGGPLTN